MNYRGNGYVITKGFEEASQIMCVASGTCHCCKQHKPSKRHTLLIRKLIFLSLELVDKRGTAEVIYGGRACVVCFLQMCKCMCTGQNLCVCWNSWVMRPVSTVMTPSPPQNVLLILKDEEYFNKINGSECQRKETLPKECDAEGVVRVAAAPGQCATDAAAWLMLNWTGCSCECNCVLSLFLANLKRSQNPRNGQQKLCCT